MKRFGRSRKAKDALWASRLAYLPPSRLRPATARSRRHWKFLALTSCCTAVKHHKQNSKSNPAFKIVFSLANERKALLGSSTAEFWCEPNAGIQLCPAPLRIVMKVYPANCIKFSCALLRVNRAGIHNPNRLASLHRDNVE